MEKKKKYPLLNLLIMPIAFIVDGLIIYLGTSLDTKIFENSTELGHGFPVVTILAFVIAIIIAIVSIVLSISLTIRGYKKKKQEK